MPKVLNFKELFFGLNDYNTLNLNVNPSFQTLRIQRNSLQEESAYYERLNCQYQPIYITRSMIESYRKEMEEVFVGSNVQEQRSFLKKFIEKIIIKDERIEILYYALNRNTPFKNNS